MIRRILLVMSLAAIASQVAAAAVAPAALAASRRSTHGAVTAAAPMQISRITQDTLRAAIEKDRRDTEDWLKSKPNSYLATIARKDFGGASSLTVGRAPDNDIRLDDPDVQPHHLNVIVTGDSFRVAAVDPGASFTLGSADRAQVVRDVKLGPGQVGVSRYLLRLSHQRYPAIIVFDPKSPRFKDYHGLKYFPVDFRYRYNLALTANPRPDTIVILSTRGNQRRAVRVGWFDFLVGKTPCHLEATRLLEPGVGEQDFSVFFRDATTGKESYPVGRYVEADRQPGGTYILDFNLAYNPACAFSNDYNCPIPPRANLLKVALRAGEMDSHYHH